MSIHTIITAAYITGLSTLVGIGWHRTDKPAAARALADIGRVLTGRSSPISRPQDWTVAELRAIRDDLAAQRMRPTRARRYDRRLADYRRRCHLQSAGYQGVFPGGPRRALP